MTEREKMLAGELYDCGDSELLNQWHKAKNLMRDYNLTDTRDAEEKDRILSELLGGRGKNLWITAPFYVDYGNNIYFGNNCEVNLNCTFLDSNKIIVGDTPSSRRTSRFTQPSIQPAPGKDLASQRLTAPLNSARPGQRRLSLEITYGSAAGPLSFRRYHRRQCCHRRGKRGYQRHPVKHDSLRLPLPSNQG